MKIDFKSLYVGIAIGDAFGAGLEFQDRNWIRKNVDFTKFINRRSFIDPDSTLFTKDYHDWNYTDDTEMTIANSKAIFSNKVLTELLLIDFFKKEYDHGFAINGYFRNGHGAIRWFFDKEKTIEEIKLFQINKKYPGNAPPMRAVPFGFLPLERLLDAAKINATCTHPHPKAIDASIGVAIACKALLIDKIDQKNIILHCLKYLNDAETVEKLKLAENLPAFNQLTDSDFALLCGPQPLEKPEFLSGICGLSSNSMYTLICVLYVLKHSFSSFEGLKSSILIGGDVDSLAAIVTGILGAKYGLDSVPYFMLEEVEGKAYLEEIAEQMNRFWLETL
jgi:ADP-ribosylglycohydrolase